MLSIWLPSLTRVYQLGMRAEAERRGTLLLLSLHMSRDKHGRCPAALDRCELDDPSARIDPLSGKQFIYQLRDGVPWLYSIGFDGDDDNGTHDRRWGEREPGGDFVFTPMPDSE